MHREDLRHFLIVYDTADDRIVSRREFTDEGEAAAAYDETEGEYKNERTIEVVLVSADSIETIKKTHGNYFGTPTTSPFLAGTR